MLLRTVGRPELIGDMDGDSPGGKELEPEEREENEEEYRKRRRVCGPPGVAAEAQDERGRGHGEPMA